MSDYQVNNESVAAKKVVAAFDFDGTPTVKMAYMVREIPLTSRVRQVLQAWGTKLTVVRTAASEPIQSVESVIMVNDEWFSASEVPAGV